MQIEPTSYYLWTLGVRSEFIELKKQRRRDNTPIYNLPYVQFTKMREMGWQAPPCRKGRRPFLSGDSVASAKRSLAAQTVLHNAGDGVATGVRKLMGTPEIVVCTDARCSAL
ncbi:MAG: hypothetical protein LHW48_05870 [Candidatus Cloacimonetes bacterium]|nr:hypothetical protein [Candidatus Cloacimonadota bacterium]